jgi:hypothetical protein
MLHQLRTGSTRRRQKAFTGDTPRKAAAGIRNIFSIMSSHRRSGIPIADENKEMMAARNPGR